ncbi:hypothetical protein GCM10010411_69420 [Actinomadura fulvescens]|uniref:Uncharacterized protein n=1 Tax=Actinomadura fulvescens TaxID=46160 RepID=A0ABP6CQN6_9ACTN
MQSPNLDDDLRLTFYVKDLNSKGTQDCPTIYRTNRDTWGVQGEEPAGEGIRAQLHGLKPSETLVEVPDTLMDPFVRQYVKERYGVDLGPAAGGTA